ncbi:hypothetical protein [Actinoplanes sp. NPDC026623]|uniref:hypothetical protein n=1 Tax=Actinoplanes sp. NPDC026623 TaxID=3155610 RepID=UPI0033C6BEC7
MRSTMSIPHLCQTFTDEEGNVVLRREVKTIKGTYNSFSQNLSKGADQVEGDGEVVIQSEISPAQFEEYLAKFRAAITRHGRTAPFKNVRVRIRNSKGDETAGDSVVPSTPTTTGGIPQSVLIQKGT